MKVEHLEEPLFLVFMERIVGFILLVIGAILFHSAYTNWASLGSAVSLFFIIISIVLLLLGLILLISKTE